MRKAIVMLTMILTISMAAWPTAAWSVGPYENNGNGTVIDRGTDLQWQQATADTNSDGVVDSADELTWQAALAYCENLNLAGYTDWRLPNIRELTSIMDDTRSTPAIDPTFQSQLAAYWSSTTNQYNTRAAWYVNFYLGLDGYNADKSSDYLYVRCVRSGLSVISPTIAQSPMSGPPGTIFTQWGTGLTPDSTARLYARNPDGNEHYIRDVDIDETGHFEITYESSIDKEPGSYAWWVIDGPTDIKSNEVSYEITEFQPTPVTLTLLLEPQTVGRIVTIPPDEVCDTSCSYNYDAGTQIELTATANEGWTFECWSDGIDCISSDNPLTTMMGDDKSLTAVFSQKTGPCLTITEISVKDTETGGEPESGSPATVEITIQNDGDSATEDISVFVSIFSIDVQDSDCDQVSGEWKDGEKLIQAEVYDNLIIEGIAPGQSTKITVEHTFFNACYTDRLRVGIVSTEAFLCGLNSIILGELHYFKPMPNPDAFLNCWSELSTLVAMPILRGAGVDGDTIILAKGIMIKGIKDYKIYEALKEKDFRAFGKALFSYLYDTAVLASNAAGMTLVSSVMTAIKTGTNEWNHRGCGEAFPSVAIWFIEFMEGIADAVKEAGYGLWTFAVGSPVDIEVDDDQGNAAYVGKFGEVCNTIPNSTSFIIKKLGEDPIKVVMALGGDPYVVNLYGTSSGTCSFSVVQPKNDGHLVSFRYNEIILSPSTHAKLNISSDSGVYPLSIDSDGDAAVDYIIEPDSLEILYQKFATICSVLGNNLKRSFLDQDIFTFFGAADEEVVITLKKDNTGVYFGDRTTLLLKDRIRKARLFKIDRSALPNSITATLPATGKYLVAIFKQPKFFWGKSFGGDYCIKFESSGEAWTTFEATRWVE